MTAGTEAERVAELYDYVDPFAAHSPEIEDLVCEAAQVAGVAMATLNLLDAEQQCQVAPIGFAGCTTPRRDAMCNVTLELRTFVHVRDASKDVRFVDSPWVDGRLGDVRFYASAPVITPRGHIIGTLCVFDIEPHQLTDTQIRELEQLARRVIETLTRERGSHQ